MVTRYTVQIGEDQRLVELTPAADGRYEVKLYRSIPSKPGENMPDSTLDIGVSRTGPGAYLIDFGGAPVEAYVLGSGTEPAATVCLEGRTFAVECRTQLEEELRRSNRDRGPQTQDRHIRSPMPGKVVAVHVRPGDMVERGSRLVVLEAMKMENELHAHGSGQIVAVHVKPGDAVDSGALLLELAPTLSES